jgi:hypothetical protein
LIYFIPKFDWMVCSHWFISGISFHWRHGKFSTITVMKFGSVASLLMALNLLPDLKTPLWWFGM